MKNYFTYRKNTVQRHCEGDSPKQSRKAPSLLERAGGEVFGLLRSARNDVLRQFRREIPYAIDQLALVCNWRGTFPSFGGGRGGEIISTGHLPVYQVNTIIK